MRWNETEVLALSRVPPDWEGLLTHKPPPTSASGPSRILKSKPESKERWFKLRANCLFYFKKSPGFGPGGSGRPPSASEPLGVLLLENSHAQQEGFAAESVHAFSVIFGDEPGKKHLFLAESQRAVAQWIEAINNARYEHLRTKVLHLQIKLRTRTGRDPLLGTGFENNPVYSAGVITSEVHPPDLDPADPSTPKPKPRTKSKGKKSTFQSHVVESWEPVTEEVQEDDPVGSKKASFRSHIPEGTLIDFG